MSRFVYQVRDANGRSESGVLDASDVNEASRMLRHDGKIVINIHEEYASAVGSDAYEATRKKKIRKDDVIFFANQLSVMVDTGVPLSEALDSIAEQTEHGGMKVMLQDISDQVKGGIEFSTALEKYPKSFGTLFTSMMRASEASGTMGQMLVRISDYLSQERDTRKKVRGAMVYPVCMLGFCVSVVVGLLVFVLPRFEKIYAGKSAALPLPTKILISMSNGIITYWPLLMALIAGSIVGLYMYLRTPAGKLMLDRVRIFIPILGPMYRKAYLARSLRTMATMVSSGVSMLEGLEITAQVAGNRLYARIWKHLSDRVQEGSTLTDPLFKCKLIPRTVTQMISAGERTGKLASVMDRVAQYCEDDLKIAVKTVTQMIEPIMIIVMGIIVGGIAIALLLPVFSISKVMAR